MNGRYAEQAAVAGNPRSQDAIVEVPILFDLPLLKSLEAAARSQGMTTAVLVRCLLRELLMVP